MFHYQKMKYNIVELEKYNMMNIRLLLVFVITILLFACKKEELMEFSVEDSAIYFQGMGSYTLSDGSMIFATEYRYVDSVQASFAGAPKRFQSTVLYIPLKTMGKVKNYDRPVRVVVDKEASSAVENVDFTIGLDTLFVPAFTSGVQMPVTILRTDALLSETKRIVFRLEENEYFKLDIKNFKASSSWFAKADTLSAIEFTVIFSEKYTEPSFYKKHKKDYWDEWSPKKFQVLNNVMGWTLSDWGNAGISGKILVGRLDFSAKAMQKYLQQMADDNTPVKEVDGSFMQLSPKYSVDYSKYENK